MIKCNMGITEEYISQLILEIPTLNLAELAILLYIIYDQYIPRGWAGVVWNSIMLPAGSLGYDYGWK